MYAKTLILAAGLTVLGSAPAAFAQYRPYDRPDAPGYDQRYQDYGQVTRAARSLQETATSMSYQAYRNNRRPNRDEAEVLQSLRDLAGRARHFQSEVGRYRRDPRHTADDFQALADSFDATASAMRSIDRRPYLDRGMARVAFFLDQLAPFYGRDAEFRARLGYGDRDHDRDDRYRDRERGYDRDGYRPPQR
jgi:hypothetical protein